MNDTLVQKVQSIQRCIQRARSIYAESGENFLVNDYDAQDASMLNIIRACEQAIDLANYLIKRNKLGIPASSAESFTLLAQQGLISHDRAKKLSNMVGFRNLAVHEYQRIDYTIVVYILEEGLDDLIRFVDDIMRLSM
jgi:uncharacterized protein YutE (UPF0331/DUF86 family)